MEKKIKTALISVFDKDGLGEIIKLLHKNKVQIISTGGTAEFIRQLGIKVKLVEDITKYPSLFEGRVKTLHPKIAGGILKIRGNKIHEEEAKKYDIVEIDLVISNLYPFENTLASGALEQKIIEDIDIGGITLIREAAKNFKDVVIISSKDQYDALREILKRGNKTTLEERRKLAGEGFEITSAYDALIRGYFQNTPLRYGENPHQKAHFVGDLSKSFIQLSGKELSYNNLLDTETAIMVVSDFKDPAFVIIKHTNACGLAVRKEKKHQRHLLEAYKAAYDADPVSAFGGILAANRTIGEDIAKLIKKQELFVEVIIAPDFTKKALEIFKQKKNCRILKCLPAMQGVALQAGKNLILKNKMARTYLNGILVQDRDTHIETEKDLTVVTKRKPSKKEKEDLLVAAIATKHLKSNSVAIVKDNTLVAMGCGQTSRIEALKQAIEKARKFKFSLRGRYSLPKHFSRFQIA